MGNVFKCTFEDGGEAYLEHHGIKGMKWGIWNLETQAKYGLTKGMGDLKGKIEGGGGGIVDKEGEDEDGDVVKNVIDEINAKIEELKNAEAEAESQVSQESREEYDARVTALAYEVINGDWDNGQERYDRITSSGYSYEDVQTKVNDIIYGTDDYEQGINSSMREDPDDRSRRR